MLSRIGLALAVVAIIAVTYASIYRWGMATSENGTVPFIQALQKVIESLTSTMGVDGDELHRARNERHRRAVDVPRVPGLRRSDVETLRAANAADARALVADVDETNPPVGRSSPRPTQVRPSRRTPFCWSPDATRRSSR